MKSSRIFLTASLYMLSWLFNSLLADPCILHSRKFPTKPSVHTYFCFYLCNFVSYRIS
nr:MAG TPA: hypothetical protein [Caudoviricetes sp.]